MPKVFVVGDGLSSPGGQMTDLLQNLITPFEAANNKFRVLPICPSVGFIPAVLSHLCANHRKWIIGSFKFAALPDEYRENTEAHESVRHVQRRL